jgi:hypothetical protein
MAQDNDATAECEAEITKADYSEGGEFEFVADVRVHLHNPDGKDVAVLRTYKARPKHDGLVASEDHVHEHVDYWWTDDYPANGDHPFADAGTDWPPNADLEDNDALLKECVESATFDPVAELDGLKSRDGRIRQKLDNSNK